MQFSLGTFSAGAGAPFAGLVIAERVYALERLAPQLERLDLSLQGAQSVLALLGSWDRNFSALSQVVPALTVAAAGSEPSAPELEGIDLNRLRVHPPVCVPRQTFCTVANYRSHILDTVRDSAASPRLGEPDSDECRERAARIVEERLRGPPYVCLKLPSTVIGPADPLEIPFDAQRPDWEVELGVVIGRGGRRISRQNAMSCVAGYTLVNDITVRERVARPDLPKLGSDWLQSKNSPGFLPTGPFLVPAAFVPDPYALRLSLRLNGELMQSELAADMLHDIATQIEYISQYVLLLPGDLICTGTPAGCGTRYKRFLRPGDIIEATAPGFGTQRTPCIAEGATQG